MKDIEKEAKALIDSFNWLKIDLKENIKLSIQSVEREVELMDMVLINDKNPNSSNRDLRVKKHKLLKLLTILKSKF